LAIVSLDPAATGRGQRICETLEALLRPQLYRLIGPDDVGLWLGGWDAETASVSAWRSADQYQSIRLARVLRLLLREGVPIRDRTAIFDAFINADRILDGAGPLVQLRAVRRRLGAEALGLKPGDQLCPLPTEMERRIVDALDDNGSRWELGTEAAATLLGELRRWLARNCAADGVVTVENPWSRVYVWRLLANRRSRLRVLAEEELSG
jgi:flagellar biosynthesis component FlhA